MTQNFEMVEHDVGRVYRKPESHGFSHLACLVEIWSVGNARVFRNKQAPSLVVFDRIKFEARLRVLVGAKRSGDFMLGE
jgi:hypothetical protein